MLASWVAEHIDANYDEDDIASALAGGRERRLSSPEFTRSRRDADNMSLYQLVNAIVTAEKEYDALSGNASVDEAVLVAKYTQVQTLTTQVNGHTLKEWLAAESEALAAVSSLETT